MGGLHYAKVIYSNNAPCCPTIWFSPHVLQGAGTMWEGGKEGGREDELLRRGKPRKWSSKRESAVATARVLDYFRFFSKT